MSFDVLCGDALTVLRTLPDGTADCCVTSPPYFGPRDYGVDGQIGLEPTPDEYVARLVAVFREVRRVLADDGTLWLNLGDSYGTGTVARRQPGTRGLGAGTQSAQDSVARCGGMAKQLLGIPWRVAFALQADGWYLRQDIIWAKPNPMPESVTDRCTKAHEYVFLLSKSPRYFYDAKAIREAAICAMSRPSAKKGQFNGKTEAMAATGQNSFRAVTNFRNRRSVWTITPNPFRGAHFAVMPAGLAEPCILAGSRVGGTVLDPFAGAGTTGLMAMHHGRSFLGIELNKANVDLIHQRVREHYSLFEKTESELEGMKCC